MEPIVNRVAESDVEVYNLEALWDGGEVVEFDLAPFLYQGLILREAEFRQSVKVHDWGQYAGRHVAVRCSEDAIIPTWAYMLVASRLVGTAATVAFGTLEDLVRDHFVRALEKENWERYRDSIVVIKGCGSRIVPVAAYVIATQRLQEVARKIMFENPAPRFHSGAGPLTKHCLPRAGRTHGPLGRLSPRYPLRAMRIDLSDKVVLVTGSSRGIGRAIARRMGAAGAFVALHYVKRRDAAEETAAALSRCDIFQADLAVLQDCERLIEEVIVSQGRIDVLVNNAAVAIPVPQEAPIDVWQRGWETTISINLRAPEVLTRLTIQHFLQQAGPPGHLRIVNMASRAAFRGDTPEYAAYAASKAGLVALARTIARGYGKRGIRAFTVAPGFTMTEMARDFVERYGEIVIGDVALERITEPDDIAPLVVLLASGLADHATGCTIDVNAGSYVH